MKSIIRALFIQKTPPHNDCFVHLYQEHLAATDDLSSSVAKNSDLSFLLRGNKFRCHLFVFKNCSDYFKILIEKKEKEIQKNRRYQQKSISPKMGFEMPTWMNVESFRMFIRFAYLGKLTYGNSSPNLEF
jgi:hypothetical protein